MEDLKRLAAIDIGSNAVRLLVNNVLVDEITYFKKAALYRVPVRLGEDAFIRGTISDQKIDYLLETMRAFKGLMRVFEISDYMGCATSAMREADNGAEVIQAIHDESGIDIEIISGQKEADIIYSTQIADMIDNQHAYLFVDVGGGSTEITLFNKDKIVHSKSFNIGTIRILKSQNIEPVWDEMKEWLNMIALQQDKKIMLIGSGGNINKIFKMSRNKIGKPLTASYLRSMYKMIKSYSIHQRMTILDLNPDRADVIEPAMDIFLFILKHTKSNHVLVPKIGLSDGIIRKVYDRFIHKHVL